MAFSLGFFSPVAGCVLFLGCNATIQFYFPFIFIMFGTECLLVVANFADSLSLRINILSLLSFLFFLFYRHTFGRLFRFQSDEMSIKKHYQMIGWRFVCRWHFFYISFFLHIDTREMHWQSIFDTQIVYTVSVWMEFLICYMVRINKFWAMVSNCNLGISYIDIMENRGNFSKICTWMNSGK